MRSCRLLGLTVTPLSYAMRHWLLAAVLARSSACATRCVPLRGFTSITNANDLMDGYFNGFYGEISDELAKLPTMLADAQLK